MAKELPYFKFFPAEWISGEITLEDLQTQGVFINICAYYWFKSGKLTLSEIKRRVKCKQAVFDRLIDNNLIKVVEDSIEISFLRSQLDERGHISEKNSRNGSLGGAPKGNKNAQKNNQKQPKTTNIEEEKNKKRIRKEEIEIEIVAAVPATLDERALIFRDKVAEFLPEYSKEMLRDFYDYWTERNEGGRRMRFELEKVFDIRRRLVTWNKNEKKRNGHATQKTKQQSRIESLANGVAARYGADSPFKTNG